MTGRERREPPPLSDHRNVIDTLRDELHWWDDVGHAAVLTGCVQLPAVEIKS
jgi:hypothetical protein